VALLDVDSGSSDLLVSRNGMPVFTRSVRIGGEALLGDIAKWGEALGIEVRRALEDCRAETPGLEVDRVLLSGCASSFEGLSALLRKLVNLPVEPADPAQSVRRTPRAPALKDPLYRSLSLTPLLGLVMGGGEATFDLTPETVVLRKRVLRKSRVLSSFGVLLMAALLSLSLLGATAVVAENSRWAHLKAGADAFEEKAAQVERRNAVVKAYGTLANRRSCSVELLADIQRVKPAGIFLTRVEVDEERGRLVLAGSGESRAEISGFVSNLNASRLFRDAKDSGTQTDDNNRFTFQVNASLEAAP
jgi:Tfp pilus assembly protein PilN